MMSDNSSAAAVTGLLSSLSASSVEPIQTMGRQAATMNAIKAHILQHRLQPGDPLPTEAALVAELGVSRSSVREALRTLEALDIVEIRHGSGSFVSHMSLEPMVQTLALRASLAEKVDSTFLKEIVEQRRWLDLGAAKDVVTAMEGRQSEELHACVDEMEELAQAGERFLDQDIRFHNALLAPLENQLISQTYGAFWLVHMSMLTDLGDAAKDDLNETAKAHRQMLEAAEAGDLERYISAIDRHYLPLLRLLESER